jgi:hypothetical protein
VIIFDRKNMPIVMWSRYFKSFRKGKDNDKSYAARLEKPPEKTS